MATRRLTTAQRGYAGQHPKLRAQWKPQVDAGLAFCHAAICLMPARWIAPGSTWHLGHTPDRSGWTGPEHARCNEADGGRRHGHRRAQAVPAAATATWSSICKACGKTYTRAARACGMCGAHYHPSYGEQRTCSRACGVAWRRQVYGPTGSRPDPGRAEQQAQRQAQQQRERQAALAARDEQAAHRAQQIRELRTAGMRWADIATAVGLASAGAAHNAADPVRHRNYVRDWAQRDGQRMAYRW